MSKKTTENIKPVLKMHVIKSASTERAASNALEDDPFSSSYGEGGIIQPPYDLLTLSTLTENCSELRPSVDAMIVNIEKMGHRIVPRKGIVGKNEEIPEDIKKELYEVENFFENAVLDDDIGTFEELRARRRSDLELTGNSFMEVIPSVTDFRIPAGLNHLPSWTVRLKKQDDYLTDYDAYRSVRVSEKKWEIQKFPTSKRFRRFVQIRNGGVTKVWFKEWNDPRDIDSRTGELFEGVVDEKYLAHEMIHFKLYCPRSPYGLPRIIGHLLSIYGARGAEEINYITLDNNQIPALALLATNVAISDGSIKRMTEFIEERVQGNKNYATILVIEAEPTGEGMRDPGAMKLEIKPLTEHQHTDAMFKEYISMSNNTIRRAFRLPPIFSGQCVPIETEFLTENGWKYYNDISDSECIATIKPNTGKLEFQIPTNRYSYEYNGNLIRFSNNRAIDILVTPNHRMIQRGIGDWEFVEAQNIKEWHREFMLASLEWNGLEVNNINIPLIPRKNECNFDKSKNLKRDAERKFRKDDFDEIHNTYNMDLFLEFLGYFISEGSTTNIRGPISLSQNVGFIADRMIEIVKEMGFKSTIYKNENRKNQLNITFCNISLWNWLRENCGVNSKNKCFPRKFLNLSRRQLFIFYDALMNGDGSWSYHGRDRSGSYPTTSKILADLFQELCFRLGFRSSSQYIKYDNENWSDCWRITVSSNPINHTANVYKMMSNIPYKGQVCCFTTLNSTIVTRYNGKIIVSGNSEDYNRATAESSRKLAEEQIFAPERNAHDVKLTNTLIVRMGYASSKLKSNTPNVTDNYELTQMLAVAETGGGLTPRTSASIIEDISGKDIPDPLPEINPDLPFSITKLREELAAKHKIATQSSGDNSQIELEETKKSMEGLRIIKGLLLKDHDKSCLDDETRHELMMLSFIIQGGTNG